ncbi:MAG TPA: anti-sigma factor [Rubrobacteraceae bacterium]|nr:anti-sigma factor [Rubrobacteraceae bacterium]
MNHERFDELKDAYALGALPEQERRELEEYLAAHPERQAEIDELGNVASLLALSPQEQEPPPELRRSIMDVVEAEAQRPPARTRSWLAGVRELLSVKNLALAAAALLVIGLFSWNMLLQDQVQDLQGQVASLQESQETRMVALAGTGAAQQAQVEVILIKDQKAVLTAEDMPSVPENKTYQIWVIEGDVPQPSGLFKPDGGTVAAVVEKPLDEDDVIAITIEPDGGSQQPTTDPVLTAKV